MTPEQFIQWLADMKAAGLASTDAECVGLLGMHKNSALNMKKEGTDIRTALACNALLAGLPAYGAITTDREGALIGMIRSTVRLDREIQI